MNPVDQLKATYAREDERALARACDLILADKALWHFVEWLFDLTDASADPFDAERPLVTAHNCGKASVARALMGRLSMQDPTAYLTRRKETEDVRSDRSRAIESAEFAAPRQHYDDN